MIILRLYHVFPYQWSAIILHLWMALVPYAGRVVGRLLAFGNVHFGIQWTSRRALKLEKLLLPPSLPSFCLRLPIAWYFL